jgi:hypothetical protein
MRNDHERARADLRHIRLDAGWVERLSTAWIHGGNAQRAVRHDELTTTRL